MLFGGYTAIYFYSYQTKETERLPLINKDPGKDISDKDYFIAHLTPINDSIVLAGTEGDGIFLYNLKSHDFTPLITKNILPLQAMLFDPATDEIWVSVFQNGLYRYNLKGEMKEHYTVSNSGLSNNIILDVEKHNDKIWLATDGSGGVDILDIRTGQFDNIQHIPGDINSLPVNSITILYNDSNNNLWAGSVRDGVFLFKETYIRTYKDITLGSNKGLSERVVISLFEDKKGNLWIGTDGGGINMFNPDTETFTHHLKTYGGDKVVSITDLSDTDLLVSLYGKGVFTYNTKTQTYKPFIIIDKEKNEEECFSGFVPFCYRITPDRILILSKNAYIYNVSSGRFDTLHYDKGLGNIHSLQLVYSDSDRSFMTKGNTIYVLENKDNLIKKLLVLEDNEYVNSTSYDKSKNRLWIASTAGLKYYDINSGKLEKIGTNMFHRISYMYHDAENRLWINASNMLFSYDVKDEKFMIWDDSDGFLSNDILTLYVKSSQSRYIYMGGSNGLVRIDKMISYDDDEPVTFSLQDIDMDGKIYLGNTLSSSRKFSVPQNYSSLKIRIDLNEKDLFRRILFRYRISNPNNNSVVESYSNILDLASLAPGKYDIYVSCMTKSGSWTDETNLVTLEVVPPWYNRTWFIISVICVIAALVVLSVRSLLKRNKRKMEWEMAIHQQELNEEKIQFLTNVSHELRTPPLTLIYAPLKRMLDSKGESMENEEHKKQIESIYRQANHMKGIINWILDYDRNTSLSNDLNLAFVDINELIRKAAGDFTQEFEEKQIGIEFRLDDTLKPVEIDATKIRVVISNIVMNALKFSEPETNITVGGSCIRGEYIHIWVEDKGIGLNNVDTNKLFTRFYQGGNHDFKGSGIGLSYCKELVEKHQGRIGAVDNEGAGATIYFELPYRITSDNMILGRFDDSEMYNSLIEQENVSETLDTSKYSILIVDDNKEFLQYLESELKPLFRKVFKANNGAEATDALTKYQPDILISDVMMPVMNGYQLCRYVKEKIEISHIPVILLTAKGDGDSQKMGYKLGADFYLAKPFDIELLLSVVRNQLKNKEIIKQKYQTEILTITPEQATISNADEQFMAKLNQLIKENYSDATFDVSAIIDSLAMSRASLYNKMKNITGIGISDYINKYRISVACSLLTDTDKSIADIAFETGFTSQQYFSTVFKQAMDKTPSVYRNEMRADLS